MSWSVRFYDDKVAAGIKNWPSKLFAKFLWVVDLIEKLGLHNVGMPHIKPIGKGLFEIRVKSVDGIGRAMFCMVEKETIVILSEFIKKSQKTPKQEIELALKRMNLELNKRGKV